jgi:PTH1 family peptidyl-tRNA hydrolase
MLGWLKRIFHKEEEKEDSMKFLIAGLGNIGAKYVGTRHNIGFEVADQIAMDLDGSFKTESNGDIAEVKHKGRTLILLKPSTYMNRSGKAIRYWMQKKKIKQENVLVILDDLNLDFGKIRMKGKGSDGGHNGLKDIQEMFGNTNYARLRVGIGADYRKGQQIDFVLGKWTNKEMDDLLPIIQKTSDAAKAYCSIGLKNTIAQYNGKVDL